MTWAAVFLNWYCCASYFNYHNTINGGNAAVHSKKRAWCIWMYCILFSTLCFNWLKFLYLPRSIIPADLAFFGGWVGSDTTDIHTTGFLFAGCFLPLYRRLYSRTIVLVSGQKLVQYIHDIHLFIKRTIVRNQQTS